MTYLYYFTKPENHWLLQLLLMIIFCCAIFYLLAALFHRKKTLRRWILSLAILALTLFVRLSVTPTRLLQESQFALNPAYTIRDEEYAPGGAEDGPHRSTYLWDAKSGEKLGTQRLSPSMGVVIIHTSQPLKHGPVFSQVPQEVYESSLPNGLKTAFRQLFLIRH